MFLNRKFSHKAKESLARAARAPTRRLIKVVTAIASALVLGGLALTLAFNVLASTPSSLLWGTLDTQTGHAATESRAGVTMAMFEFNWASFEPSNGVFSSSYLATMRSELAAYKAAGQRVTLGLGTQNAPSWVTSLANGRYINQNGAASTEANWVYSAAVRSAAATYFKKIAADFSLTDFWAIRITSGGDPEMLYPGGGTYWAFSPSALTGRGLPAGMTANPFPKWKPGTAGLTQAQIGTWVNWYIGGLDNVTNWQMQTLSGLGFAGYYETVTPGSGSRARLPDPD